MCVNFSARSGLKIAARSQLKLMPNSPDTWNPKGSLPRTLTGTLCRLPSASGSFTPTFVTAPSREVSDE
ncbi:hypothetical protein D3C80_2194840 [compost metagenome]